MQVSPMESYGKPIENLSSKQPELGREYPIHRSLFQKHVHIAVPCSLVGDVKGNWGTKRNLYLISLFWLVQKDSNKCSKLITNGQW